MKKKIPLTAYLALIAAMVLWGGSFIALKIAYRGFHPMFIMFVRLTLASLVFLPFMRNFSLHYRREDLKWLILMALFEPCLYFSFEAEALRYTTASQAGMICAMLPVLVAVPSYFILREKIGINMIVGFLLAVSGSIWLSLVSPGSESGPNPLLGNFLEFMAMVFATGYTISVRKLSARYSATEMTAVQAFVGAPYFLMRALFSRDAFPRSISLEPTMAILYLALLVSVLAYLSYAYGIQKTSATTSALFINLIPVITLVASILILKEPVGPVQLGASAVILTGVIISQIRFPRPERRSA